MNNVERMFLDRSLNKSGIIVYSKKDALDFVAECRRQNIRLLGIDGFFIWDIYMQPSQEDSVSYSYMDPDTVYGRAIEFLDSRADGLYFEIVCDE